MPAGPTEESFNRRFLDIELCDLRFTTRIHNVFGESGLRYVGEVAQISSYQRP